MIYQSYKNSIGETLIRKINDNQYGCSFLQDEANTDYQEYLEWVAEGNTPEEAD